MIEKEPCNLQPCPIDCVVGEWSEYSACSKDGGEPCGDTSEQNECNVDACDRPCELDPEWSDWSECSKQCDYGFTVRSKQVVKEAGPTGECPGPFSDARMQA